MKTKTYTNEYGDEFIVEEYTRKEFSEIAIDTIYSIDYSIELDSKYIDETVYVRYHDGSTFCYGEGTDKQGRFKRSGIAFGVITLGECYQVTGKYVIDEDGIIDEA